MRALVLSDTHLADTTANRLDGRVVDAAATVDVILHAGDITGRAFLEELEDRAPVHAVNPGSPTQRRRAPVRTFGLLEVADGRITKLEHVELP